MRLNGIQDVNELKRLLAAGQISNDDLNNTTLSGSFGPDQPTDYNVPVQGASNVVTNSQNPGPQQNFVRNEDTGQTIYLGPNGQQSNQPFQPNPQLGPQVTPNQAPQGMMRVVGAGNGVTMDLGTQPAQKVPLDYKRGQIDVPGAGRGYYGQDGNAYVQNPDGSMTKVLLGYDAGGSMALNQQALKNQETQANIAATNERIRASQINNPDFSNAGAGGNAAPGLTGPDFLKTLDPQVAAQVQAYADGRLPFPAGFALKSPYFQNMLRLVGQYDPSFDAANATARNATRKAFTSGPDAANLTAIQTAVNHLGNLYDSYQQLGNTGVPAWNAVANFAGNTGLIPGSAKIQGATAGVQADALAVAHELASVFRRSGMSTKEVDDWLNQISTSASPATVNGVVSHAVDLLYGRLAPLADKYNTGMGTTAQPVDLLQPGPRSVLQKLQQELGVTGHVPGTSSQPAIPASGTATITGPITSPGSQQQVLFQARQAIAQGAPREAVAARLQQAGIDPSGL